ncbi:hypothetical protein PFLmoz3_04903 [Pseudomonas fluorescens]|uniref:Uncharacterized protein n=1 Tax=Pseudomonas fluorescens TaxID=294 RepID=A0A109LD53_PSEFL|nr:hypothetical protein PFLmoz3_04903 [Pseudomonas fluorescens]
MLDGAVEARTVIAGEQNQRVLTELGEGDFALLRQRVVAAKSRHQRFLPQRQSLDAGLPGLRQQAAHADVDAPVQHVRVQAAGSALHQGQLHIGKTLGEGLQGLTEEFRQRDRAGIAYDQLAGRAGSQFGGDVLCKPGVFQRCAGIRQKVLALGGQCDRTTGAVEQAKAKLGFQSRDLPRQRRLGKVQALGRTAEVQLFGDRQEVT